MSALDEQTQKAVKPYILAAVDALEQVSGSDEGDGDGLNYVADLSSILGLDPFAIRQLSLLPGTRSFPIGHSHSDYFTYVVSGNGVCWYNGSSYEMGANDCVGFKAGTGIAHAFINEASSESSLEVLLINETILEDTVYMPLSSPESSTWLDPPIQILGKHNGRPNHPRQQRNTLGQTLIFENPPPSTFWPSTIFHSLVMSIPNGLPPPDALETAHLSILSGLSSRLSVCQFVLPPGSRSSPPRAHSKEHKFVYIVGGSGHLWLNGEIVPLNVGHCAGFCPGTGIAHCILNDGPVDLLFLEVSQDFDDDQIFYPLDEQKGQQLLVEAGRTWWDDAPSHRLGPQVPFPALLE